MEAFRILGDIIFSQWLWGITIDWSYLPINVILLAILLRRFCQFSLIKSLLFAVVAHGFSFAFFSSFVIVLMIYCLNWACPTPEYVYVLTPLNACALLAAIHGSSQLIFFKLIQKWTNIAFVPICIVLMISNIFSTFFSYLYIKVVMYYVI